MVDAAKVKVPKCLDTKLKGRNSALCLRKFIEMLENVFS